MTKLEWAIWHAGQGMPVFPILRGTKTPAIKDWENAATMDEAQIRKWWAQDPEYNIGWATGRFKDGKAGVGLDVDAKNGKNGYDTRLALELDGFELPVGRIHLTPTGGCHHIMWTDRPLRSSAGVVGLGLDIRSGGGYVLLPGSSTADGEYRLIEGDIPECPDWLRIRTGSRQSRRPRDRNVSVSVDHAGALVRATEYLRDHAPIAVAHEGGDNLTFKVAAQIRDYGVDEMTAIDLLCDTWNPSCEPPWDIEDLERIVRNAYSYAKDVQGNASAAADFGPPDPEAEEETPDGKQDPLTEFNKDHAYIRKGVLWETTDADNKPIFRHLDIAEFHLRYEPVELTTGSGKVLPLTKQWLKWPGRREYDDFVFKPERDVPARFFNLWRGFALSEPQPQEVLPDSAHEALAAWKLHALENACRGNQVLYDYLIGWFAHLLQRPWEKPSVALMIGGGKGTGKNVLVHCVARALGQHVHLAANKRIFTSNFNLILAQCLLLVLDEAYWSGDKGIEGQLKDIITGDKHTIEPKGREQYVVDNRTRVVIIGNDDWLAAASHDERRLAGYIMGDARKQDTVFFQKMLDGMESGGARLLFQFLRHYPLDRFNPHVAPKSKFLLDQKHASLDPFGQWVFDSLCEGRLLGSDFEGAWPDEADCERFRGALRRYMSDRGISSRTPSSQAIGRMLKKILPSMEHCRNAAGYYYRLPSLERARSDWDKHMGQAMEWSS